MGVTLQIPTLKTSLWTMKRWCRRKVKTANRSNILATLKIVATTPFWTLKQSNLWVRGLLVSFWALSLSREFKSEPHFSSIIFYNFWFFLTASFWNSNFWTEIGYVFQAIDPKTDQVVAIKRTSKSGEYVSREFEVLDKLRDCENVIKLLNIYYSKNEGKIVQNLVFEFCSRNLEEVIQDAKE